MNVLRVVDYTKEHKRKVSYDTWSADITKGNITQKTLDNLVLDYQISEGYSEAAEQQSIEAGLGIDIEGSNLMRDKNHFRELLYNGDIDTY